MSQEQCKYFDIEGHPISNEEHWDLKEEDKGKIHK